MEVIEAIHSWRTIRHFRPEPLERAEIAELLWHAVQVSTPPGDVSPWQFCVLESTERIEALGQRAMDYARQNRPAGEAGWGWVDIPGFRVFWGAPAAVVIASQSGNAYAAYDCHRAAQNLVLAAHVRGVGSCWLGAPLPWLRSPGVAREIGIADDLEAAVVIALGKPVVQPPPKSRPGPEIIWSADL